MRKSSLVLHYPSVPAEVDGGAIVLTQRIGHGTCGEPVFVEVAAPSDEAMLAVLHKIITRMMRLVTRRGGATYLMMTSLEFMPC